RGDKLPTLMGTEVVGPDNCVAEREALVLQLHLQVPGPPRVDLQEQTASQAEDTQNRGQPLVGPGKILVPGHPVLVAGIRQADVEGGIGDDEIGTPGRQAGQDLDAVAGDDAVNLALLPVVKRAAAVAHLFSSYVGSDGSG